MKDKIKILAEEFRLEIEERKIKYPSEIKTLYFVKGFDENPNLDFILREEEDIEKIKNLLQLKPFFYKDFIAIKVEDKIQIALTTISFRSLRGLDREDADGKNLIEVAMNYFKNELNIIFKYADENDPISQYLQILKGSRRFYRRTPLIIEITNYKKTTAEGIETDTRNIINSVLFDIEYSYGYGFETISLESLTRRFIRRSTKFSELPDNELTLVYKSYIPELIEYFHIGEKVDYLPFKFICYYHIIEYFLDKSAYLVVSEYIKNLILKPDFHIKTDNYVGQAINFFKKENDRYTTDKVKIDRVLKQFVEREELKTYLEDIELSEHFSDDKELACSKPLKLSKIDFSTDATFYQSLTKRIYSLRCSIVHSNPDFDDSKAIPFIPNPGNLDILRFEIELIYEIARMIIVGSKE